METEVTTWSEFLNERKATAEQIQGSKEKFKRARLWQIQSRNWVGKLTIGVKSFDKKNDNIVHLVYQYHQSRLTSLSDGH